MAVKGTGLGVLAAASGSTLALVLVLTVAGVGSASAEFFGCKTPHTTVTYTSQPLYSPAPRVHTRARYSTRYTHEFAAQRSRHVTYSPRRSHRRQYDRW